MKTFGPTPQLVSITKLTLIAGATKNEREL